MLIVTVIFAIGYLLIALERPLRLEKSAIALITGGVSWTVLSLAGLAGDHASVHTLLGHHVTEIAAIVFFLMGAMTIVEVIDSHDGFMAVAAYLRSRNKRVLLVVVSALSFVLSALLDNMTTTIVMVAIARKLLDDDTDLMVFAGMIVIAANSGGAFSPIGDVTTTMLWIGGQLSTANIVTSLFIPSVVSAVLPLAGALFMVKGTLPARELADPAAAHIRVFERRLVLFLGLGLMVLVPVFKLLTGLPPFLGILFALGILWAATERLHKRKSAAQKHPLSVMGALSEIDLPSILFFVGILLTVAALQVAGVLGVAAGWLSASLPSMDLIMVFLGLVSAVVDNVPLVAAAMNMFPLAVYPSDSRMWELLAFCAGTGGSLLIIGSAAGVTAMGACRISFGWYAKRFSLLALLGYAGGIGTYLLLNLAG